MSFTKLGKSNFSDQIHLIPAFFAFALALFFHSHYKRPQIIISKQDSAVNINSFFLKVLSVGNKRLIADTLWIQTLIESDLDTHKGNALNNWMYLRFNSIADLDPLFYENYLYGGQYLSIVKDDEEGAADIMTKGLVIYPDDYLLNFNQGFNYYFELGNLEKGIFHLEKIQDNPRALRFIKSLVIKLKHQVTPDLSLTLVLLKETYEKTKDKMLRDKLASDIYSVKALIDLECLNANKSNCETRDAYGEVYIQKNGIYQTAKPFKPYKIYSKNN